MSKITRYTGLIVLGDLLRGKKVIDCGCGEGAWLRILQQLLEPSLLLGIDFDFYKLKKAGGHCADACYALSDLENLGVREGAFDYFFCVETLEHIHQRDNSAVFDSIYNVLGQGGRLLVSTPGNRGYCMGGTAHCQFLSRKNLMSLLVDDGRFSLRARAVYYKYGRTPTMGPYNFSNLMVFEKEV